MFENKTTIPDPDEVAKIAHELFPTGLIATGLQSLWKWPSYGLQITTEEANVLLGFSDGPTMQIVSIRVSKEREGIGKRTVGNVERVASSLGINKIEILNGADKAGFWENCGYRRSVWRHNFRKDI